MTISELTPAVSVIIPTFNRVTKVVNAIDSVLEQSYPEKCREVIVVDDGSSDGTVGVLSERYGSRIRLLQQTNSGPSAARNKGIDASQHEIVAFLDSDDRWLQTKLEQQVPSLNIPDVVLSYSNWSQRGRSTPASRFEEIDLQLDAPISVFDDPLSTLVRPKGSGIWTSTCVGRKEALRRCGQFDERMKICEDIRLWFRLAGQGKFTVVREALVEKGDPGDDNLVRPEDPAYASESAQLRLELFWEVYARSANAPPEVLARLRQFIVRSLYEQSVCYALSHDYSKARRKAMEALAFAPSGLDLTRILTSACSPWLVGHIKRSRRSEHSAPRSQQLTHQKAS
jgi:glycosyltransferase involved in cell wall biosynthesis